MPRSPTTLRKRREKRQGIVHGKLPKTARGKRTPVPDYIRQFAERHRGEVTRLLVNHGVWHLMEKREEGEEGRGTIWKCVVCPAWVDNGSWRLAKDHGAIWSITFNFVVLDERREL